MGNCMALPPGAEGGLRSFSVVNITQMSSVGTKKNSSGIPNSYHLLFKGYSIEVAFQRAQGRRPHQEDFYSLCSLNSMSTSQFRHDDLFGPPSKFESQFFRPDDIVEQDEDEMRGPPSDVAWFAVYDGHGGEKISKYAAEHLHASFLDKFNQMKDKNNIEELCSLYKKCFLEFDDDIKRLAPDTKSPANGNCLSTAEFNSLNATNNSGSTATIMSLSTDGKGEAQDPLLTIAHCGDSRLVSFSVDKPFSEGNVDPELKKEFKDSSLLTYVPNMSSLPPKEALRFRKMLRSHKNKANTEARNVFAKRIYATADHQPMEPTELRRILNDGGQVINNRVNGVLAVSRALGDMDQKKEGGLIATPETFCVPLGKLLEGQEEMMVVLASDGLWTYFTSDQVQSDVTELLCRGLSLRQACQVITERVIIDCKGIDNTSIILIRIKKDNEEEVADFKDEEKFNQEQKLEFELDQKAGAK